jgi:hypothetical protein
MRFSKVAVFLNAAQHSLIDIIDVSEELRHRNDGGSKILCDVGQYLAYYTVKRRRRHSSPYFS